MPTVLYTKFIDGIPRTHSFSVKTYALIKKNLKSYLDDCYYRDAEVSVYRSRRGEWGEWFENWKYNENKKPYIIKQGWM